MLPSLASHSDYEGSESDFEEAGCPVKWRLGDVRAVEGALTDGWLKLLISS